MRYDPNVIINRLEQALGINYNDIYHYLTEVDVKLKDEDISKFLGDKYLKDNPKIKKTKKKNSSKSSEELVEKFKEDLDYEKYRFEPYTLQYFKNYISILKNKCFNLIKIIDGIINKSIPSDVLKELDIKLDKKGNVLMSDVERIITPFIYNFIKLQELDKKANDLKTYLVFKISLDDVYKNGNSEDELYPRDNLQNRHFEIEGENGYIPYTEKQKKLIKKEERKILETMCDVVKNLK